LARSVGAPIEAQLADLSRHEGVMRENLFHLLGSDLRQLWHITPEDSPVLVRRKVIWQLGRLVDQLGDTENKEIARVCFNITGDPELHGMGVVGRKQWLARRQASPHPSESTSSRAMSTEILPTFAHSLRTAPPPAWPEGRPSDSQPRPTAEVLPAPMSNQEALDHGTVAPTELHQRNPAPSGLLAVLGIGLGLLIGVILLAIVDALLR